MGPTRTAKSQRHGETSSAGRAGSSKTKPRRPQTDKEPATAPGVQKLKSSLRQTRRLLAKDNLAADVRVETERRLKALEADLVQAEVANKERSLALRYHKIKFFERQKVVRKLNQTKKQALTDDGPAGSKLELETPLSELRVDLNYILHYPKDKKYISLFPPEVRQGAGKAAAASSESEKAKTDAAREEIRSWIRKRMAKGELAKDPELHLDPSERGAKKRGAGKAGTESLGIRDGGQKKPEKIVGGPVVESDAFFGDDDDESSDSDGMDEV